MNNKTENQGSTQVVVAALIGAPNAGKSTIVNYIVDDNVSIVTPKVQTTRRVLRGILTTEDTQMILVDTPGVFTPRRPLERAMVKTAWRGIDGADVTLFIVDAKKGISPEVITIAKRLKQEEVPVCIILNKIDIVPKDTLLELSIQLTELIVYDHIFMVSAKTGDGMKDVLETIKNYAKPSPFLFDPEQTADIAIKDYAAEVTRQELMLMLQQELPYGLAVVTEKFEEQKKGMLIHQLIVVEREAHKKIIVGKHGQTIKQIGQKARRILSKQLDCKVHLYLFVKVNESWVRQHDIMQEIGLTED